MKSAWSSLNSKGLKSDKQEIGIEIDNCTWRRKESSKCELVRRRRIHGMTRIPIKITSQITDHFPDYRKLRSPKQHGDYAEEDYAHRAHDNRVPGTTMKQRNWSS